MEASMIPAWLRSPPPPGNRQSGRTLSPATPAPAAAPKNATPWWHPELRLDAQTEKTGKREPIANPVLYLLVGQVVEGL